MRAVVLSLVLALFPLASPAQKPITLAGLQGHARPLLIFAPRPDDALLLIQLRRLKEDGAGLQQFNIIMIGVPYENPAPTEIALTPEDAETARRRLNVSPTDFAVILVDKDGSVKLRSARPVSFNQIRDALTHRE